MAVPARKPATPLELAQYGHFAALLRKFMTEKDMTPPQLMEAIGAPHGAAQIYKWIAGTGAPGPQYAAKISKLTGIPVDEIRKRKVNKRSYDSVASVANAISNVTAIKSRAHNSDVLQFQITTENEARIRLDMTMPVEQGIKMLQVVLNAGLLASVDFSAEE